MNPDAREVSGTRTAAAAALASRLTQITGTRLGRADRVAAIDDALVASISDEARALTLADVSAGDGGELRQPRDPTLAPRLHSSRSSCALAVNAFGVWRADSAGLTVAGHRDFSSLRFEEKLPIAGVRGRPPNLDVVLDGPTSIAVESKLIEYLRAHAPASFAEAHRPAMQRLGHPTWAAAFDGLVQEPRLYRLFDAAQILKHYLGLRSRPQAGKAVLLYLHWEPTDWERYPVFGAHREEVDTFADGLADPEVEFRRTTYSELFDEWDGDPADAATRRHVGLLRDRYELALGR